MLEILKDLSNEDYDAYFFLPGEKNNTMYLEGSNYVNKGEEVDGSDFKLGKCYHILIFKEDKKGMIATIDRFEGIIGAPLEYISEMIKANWYGMLCLKTTTSNSFVDDIFDRIQNN
jgi:hypothetical protein